MPENKLEIITKIIEKKCGCCCPEGTPTPSCKSCKGTGKIYDNMVYHIVNGMCWDGDTVK